MIRVLLYITLFLVTMRSETVAQNVIIEEKVKFLALGDSYTFGESVSVDDRWPAQLITELRKKGFACFDPRIIAQTGWRTDDLMRAVTTAKLSSDYTLVSLLIGVNNFYQGKSAESYAMEFEALVNTAIKLAANRTDHVFIVSIPDYGFTPFGQSNQENISQGIDLFNSINKRVAANYGIQYFNITDISRRGLDEPDLVASDGLHPSAKMYASWVNLILRKAKLIEPTGSR